MENLLPRFHVYSVAKRAFGFLHGKRHRLLPSLIFLLSLAIPISSFGFPNLDSNSWYTTTPSNDMVYTSQIAIAYDNVNDTVIQWNGHLPGGGYPQLNEIQVFNIENELWSMPRPQSDVPVNHCTGGDASWNPIERVYVNIGNIANGSHRWFRNLYLKGDIGNYSFGPVYVYDPSENRWQFLYRGKEDGPYPNIYPLHANVYDRDTDLLLFQDGSSTSNGTWVYDLYTNRWTHLVLWNNSPTPGGHRSQPGILYDSKEKKFVLFGGSGQRRDTWVFDLNTSTWENRTPDPIPQTGYPPFAAGGTGGVYMEGNDIGPAATYDDINHKCLFFIPRIAEGKIECWAYDTPTNTWEQRNSMNYIGPHVRGGDIEVAWMHKHNAAVIIEAVRPSGPSKVWFYRYANRSPEIEAPSNVTLSVNQTNVGVQWIPVNGASGYNIYRATGNNTLNLTFNKQNEFPITSTSWTDNNVSAGSIFYYRTTTVGAGGRESRMSLIARTQPKLIWEGHVSSLSTNRVKVEWNPRDQNVTGYNLYRAECDVEVYPIGVDLGVEEYTYTAQVVKRATPGAFSKVNLDIITDTNYYDNVDLNNPGGTYKYHVYAYRVTSVNKLGIESGYSTYWLTIPSAVRRLNWRAQWSDSTGNVKLGWLPNAEEGIKGYSVYFMGPAYDYKMSKLNDGPVQDTTFIDQGRQENPFITYYVTAIDSLGQEGIPSDRALVNRNELHKWDDYGFLNGYYVDFSEESLPPLRPSKLRVLQ